MDEDKYKEHDTGHEPGLSQDHLARLRDSPRPHPALEDRVVHAARREGLVRRRPMTRVVPLIAAASLIFAVGAASGRYLWPATAPTTTGAAGAGAGAGVAARSPQYMFLLAGDVTPAADGSTRAEEYGQWARDVRSRGIGISGLELADASRVVRGRSDTDFPELAGVGGFFLVEAASDEAAAALAQSSPHVKYGGSVVVKRVVGR